MTKHTRYSVDNKIYVYVLNASCHLKATQSRIICRVLAPDGVRFLKNKALTTLHWLSAASVETPTTANISVTCSQKF